MNLRVGTTKLDSTGYFNAVVADYSRNPTFTFLGNITSNLSVIVYPESVVSGKNISCDDGITNTSVPSLLLTMAGLLRKYWAYYYYDSILLCRLTFLPTECDL